jgi:hypothetical protein
VSAPRTDTATRLRAASQALMGTKSGSKFCQLLEQAAIELESLSGPEDEACDLIHQALQQIDYLHQKFQPTGTGEAVMARLDAYLRKRECSSATPQHTKEDV